MENMFNYKVKGYFINKHFHKMRFQLHITKSVLVRFGFYCILSTIYALEINELKYVIFY